MYDENALYNDIVDSTKTALSVPKKVREEIQSIMGMFKSLDQFLEALNAQKSVTLNGVGAGGVPFGTLTEDVMNPSGTGNEQAKKLLSQIASKQYQPPTESDFTNALNRMTERGLIKQDNMVVCSKSNPRNFIVVKGRRGNDRIIHDYSVYRDGAKQQAAEMFGTNGVFTDERTKNALGEKNYVTLDNGKSTTYWNALKEDMISKSNIGDENVLVFDSEESFLSYCYHSGAIKEQAPVVEGEVPIEDNVPVEEQALVTEQPLVQEQIDNSFIFTGQSTDLRYFAEHNEMPISLIESIPDENLKNAVKDELNKAALSGKVNIDNVSGKITITPQGKEFINRPQFKKAAAQDVQNHQAALSDVQSFALNGTEQDLHFFAHADTLDMKLIYAHPDVETVTKVVGNIQKMKESGLVAIEGATVKATAKGQELIAKAAAQGAIKGTTQAAVTGGTAAVSGAATGGIGTIVVAVGDVALKVGEKAIKAVASSSGLK